MLGVKQLANKQKSSIRVRISILLHDKNGKICFVRHKKDGRIYWLLPGGGQDPLETAKETAARELNEELCMKAQDYEFLFARESINKDNNRHILFMVFRAINPDFSTIATGIDERVDGYDFFSSEEFKEKPVYPAIKQDLSNFLNQGNIDLFRSLEWIP
jgi:ADP-ribose pyrophosphatase YjhB (NUDIX family)